MYLLILPKYSGKQIFSHGSFPEVSQSKRRGKKKRERKLVITMASNTLQTPPRVAHAKSPGPMSSIWSATILNTSVKGYSVNSSKSSKVWKIFASILLKFLIINFSVFLPLKKFLHWLFPYHNLVDTILSDLKDFLNKSSSVFYACENCNFSMLVKFEMPILKSNVESGKAGKGQS